MLIMIGLTKYHSGKSLTVINLSFRKLNCLTISNPLYIIFNKLSETVRLHVISHILLRKTRVTNQDYLNVST